MSGQEKNRAKRIEDGEKTFSGRNEWRLKMGMKPFETVEEMVDHDIAFDQDRKDKREAAKAEA